MKIFTLLHDKKLIGTMWADKYELSKEKGKRFIGLKMDNLTIFISSFSDDEDVEVEEVGTVVQITIKK